MLISQIADCALSGWSPGIGDPSAVGWLTVVAYLLAASLSLALGVTRDRRAVERAFWIVAGAGLLFLAVNKQLDLQSFLTATGRCAAKLQGWYDTRGAVQVGFIVALTGAAVIGGAGVLWTLRNTVRRTGVALLGLGWITGFVLVRAVGFHHVDRLISVQMNGMRLNWVFELGGIMVFILGCALAFAAPERAQARR